MFSSQYGSVNNAANKIDIVATPGVFLVIVTQWTTQLIKVTVATTGVTLPQCVHPIPFKSVYNTAFNGIWWGKNCGGGLVGVGWGEEISS